MQPEIFIPFIFFSFLAAIILGPIMLKERTKRSAHELVSKAIDRGQTLDPELIQQLSQSMLIEGDRARRSLGSAVIMLALAGACVGIGFVTGGMHNDWDDGGILVPAVLFGALGVAFALLAVIDFAAKKRAA